MSSKTARAKSKFVKISPQKVRRVADAVRGMGPKEAMENLRFMQKKAAEPLYKTIKSAMANATHNFDMQEEKLVFKELSIGEGSTLKRWRPVARGRAHQILKRTSHIKVILEEKNGTEG